MAKTTSFNLGDHFETFVNQQLSTGRYGSVSEVVRAGLRLLEEREAKIQALRDAIREGEESGIAEDFNFDEFIRQKRTEQLGPK